MSELNADANSNTNEPDPCNPPTDLISLSEAADILPRTRPGRKVSFDSLYRWIRNGKLRGWKLGRILCVSRQEVLDLLKPIPVRKPPTYIVPNRTREAEKKRAAEYLDKMGV